MWHQDLSSGHVIGLYFPSSVKVGVTLRLAVSCESSGVSRPAWSFALLCACARPRRRMAWTLPRQVCCRPGLRGTREQSPPPAPKGGVTALWAWLSAWQGHRPALRFPLSCDAPYRTGATVRIVCGLGWSLRKQPWLQAPERDKPRLLEPPQPAASCRPSMLGRIAK